MRGREKRTLKEIMSIYLNQWKKQMAKHLLERPTIIWIAARDLYVDPKDLELDQQRPPEERRGELIKLYGEQGERFSLEHCGALKVKERGRGKYAIKDGGGRWWAVMNLLNKPELKLPCVVMERTSDLDAFVVSQKVVRVPPGKVFMARGNDPKNAYEHRVSNVLKDLGFTTTPGKGPKTVKVNCAIFGYDLGVLRTALMISAQYWSQGEYVIEGLALSGLIGFLYTYKDDPKFKIERLHHILKGVDYEDLKESARQFLPRNKEHARQWGPAMAKELATRYNLSLSKQPRINIDDLAGLQAKVQGHEHYPIFGQVWEMRKKVTPKRKRKPHLKIVSSR